MGLQLLRVAHVSNFVIANELSSMMMVHLARSPELRFFWIDNIFSSHGNRFHIVRMNQYVDTSVKNVTELTYWDLVATCRANGAVPIAIKSGEQGKWTFSPPDKSVPLKLCETDYMVV